MAYGTNDSGKDCPFSNWCRAEERYAYIYIYIYIFENSNFNKRVFQLISKNGSTFHYAPLFKIVSILIKC